MHQILEDYKTIYQDEVIGKSQRKRQYQATSEWLNREYTDIPNLQELMAFCNANRNIKFVKQFYDKLLFPQIRISEDKYDADALLMLFQNKMIMEYQKYLLWEVSVLELENIVLNKYPNSKTILEHRYERQMWWFNHSIHEIPSGILCDNNGASIEDLQGMKKDLAEFQKLCSLFNADNNEHIKYIFNMYCAYEQYLLHKNLYLNFKEYLEVNSIDYQ